MILKTDIEEYNFLLKLINNDKKYCDQKHYERFKYLANKLFKNIKKNNNE